MKSPYRLTPEEFEEIKPRLVRMSDRSIDVAYQVLVNGATQLGLSRKIGITQQSINGIVKAVYSHFEKHYAETKGPVPKDWVKVSVMLPPDHAKLVLQMEKSARVELMKKRRSGGFS